MGNKMEKKEIVQKIVKLVKIKLNFGLCWKQY